MIMPPVDGNPLKLPPFARHTEPVTHARDVEEPVPPQFPSAITGDETQRVNSVDRVASDVFIQVEPALDSDRIFADEPLPARAILPPRDMEQALPSRFPEAIAIANRGVDRDAPLIPTARKQLVDFLFHST